jgi:hypothetical protein
MPIKRRLIQAVDNRTARTSPIAAISGFTLVRGLVHPPSPIARACPHRVRNLALGILPFIERDKIENGQARIRGCRISQGH